ncbi:thiamine phosphate synthase [Gammaproteobacteria bacterium AB-CW1]|uniref:Thiamine-phosphate synthase n=1 Tax=Natronospira elongata TaxID=3110268 RepID=A0AAP6JDD5_9GAMM|nr:thiamine phosphate synthase [Gammaproteobacteria bacterium AB-CW1]
MSIPVSGIYVLTDHDGLDDGRLLSDVEAALQGGVAMIQYRDKSHDHSARHRRALALRAQCRDYGTPLIINDDVELCAAVDADGVHLGRDDGQLESARQQLGPDKLIGVSCYNELNRARAAAQAGADYLAFGSIFPSDTKPNAVHAPLALLQLASAQFPAPVCAIGGIGPANVDRVAAAGADLVAVIGSVWSGDPRENVARLKQAFEQGRQRQPS